MTTKFDFNDSGEYNAFMKELGQAFAWYVDKQRQVLKQDKLDQSDYTPDAWTEIQAKRMTNIDSSEFWSQELTNMMAQYNEWRDVHHDRIYGLGDMDTAGLIMIGPREYMDTFAAWLFEMGMQGTHTNAE